MLPIGFEDLIGSGDKLELVGDEVLICFGKHRGKSLKEIPPGYLRFLVQNVFTSQMQSDAIYRYLEIMNDRGFEREEAHEDEDSC